MVDKTMKELQAHGTPGMPIASYEWFGNDFNNMELECHWHKEWELFTVIEGRAYFTINGERTEIGIGDVAFIQGGELHMSKAIDNEPFRYKALVFSPSLLHLPSDEMLEAKYIRPLLEGKYRLPVVLTKAKNGGAPLKLFDRIFKEVHERRPFYELRCKAGLFEILAYWLENSEQEQDAVKA